MKEFTIESLSTMDLLFKYCDCGHVTVFGFHQQVEWTRIDGGQFFIRRCEECGDEDRLVFKPRKNNLEVSSGAGI
jgi:hypothetical protein